MKPCRGYYARGKGYPRVEIGLCEVVLRSKSGCMGVRIGPYGKVDREVCQSESGSMTKPSGWWTPLDGGNERQKLAVWAELTKPKSGCGPLPIWLWSKAGREVVANESGCGVRTGRLDAADSGGGMVESGRR